MRTGVSLNRDKRETKRAHPQQTKGDFEQRLAAGGGGVALSTSIRTPMESRLGGRFNDVRVHSGASAAELNKELNARAFTYGSHIWLGAGESVDNHRLMAHELAHVRQTRLSSGAAAYDETALERNADDLASGQSVTPLPAPQGVPLRQQLQDEPWYMVPVRLSVLRHYRQLVQQLRAALRTGGLLPNETGRSGGRIMEMFQGRTYSRTQRNAILLRLIDNLEALIWRLQWFPVPESWNEEHSAEYSASSASSRSAYVTSAVMFHLHWSAERHRPREEVMEENTYIFSLLSPGTSGEQVNPGEEEATSEEDENPVEETPTSGTQHMYAMSPGTATGYFILVRDPVRRPQSFQYFTHHIPITPGSIVVEVMRDERGYYYQFQGRRVYIRRPY